MRGFFQGNCATTWAWIIRITLSLFVGTIVLSRSKLQTCGQSAQGLRNSCDRSKPNCLICDHKTLSRCVLIRLSFRHPWKWTKRGFPHRKSARTLSASMVGGKALELRVVFRPSLSPLFVRFTFTRAGESLVGGSYFASGSIRFQPRSNRRFPKNGSLPSEHIRRP